MNRDEIGRIIKLLVVYMQTAVRLIPAAIQGKSPDVPRIWEKSFRGSDLIRIQGVSLFPLKENFPIFLWRYLFRYDVPLFPVVFARLRTVYADKPNRMGFSLLPIEV